MELNVVRPPFTFQALVPDAVREEVGLRDYFAAHAIPALMAAYADGWTHEGLAAECYALADALLAARERRR